MKSVVKRESDMVQLRDDNGPNYVAVFVLRKTNFHCC